MVESEVGTYSAKEKETEKVTSTEAAIRNVRDLISKNSDLLDQMLAIARESEHPRAFEVANQILKTNADLNRQLVDLESKRNDGESKESSNPQATLVLTTAQLQQLIQEESSE